MGRHAEAYVGMQQRHLLARQQPIAVYAVQTQYLNLNLQYLSHQPCHPYAQEPDVGFHSFHTCPWSVRSVATGINPLQGKSCPANDDEHSKAYPYELDTCSSLAPMPPMRPPLFLRPPLPPLL